MAIKCAMVKSTNQTNNVFILSTTKTVLILLTAMSASKANLQDDNVLHPQ
jgi:hypothetical protein